MTSDLQIRMARLIADEIAKLKGVASCQVDDWSDSGSFRVFARLQKNPFHTDKTLMLSSTVNLRSLSASINHILNTRKTVFKEHISCPHRRYWLPRGGGRKVFQGYEEDAIQIDFTVPEGITFQDIPKPEGV